MEAILPHAWKEEFARAAAERRAEQRRKDELVWQQQQQRERDKEQQAEEKRDEEEALQQFADALAPPEQIAAFRTELDRHDTATVAALMQNQEALNAVRQRIDDMLMEAYVMPDGRRVFRTRDGSRVFDEHGQPVTVQELDPALIRETQPVWEDYEAARRERDRLQVERQQLLDYQAQLDRARDRLDRGDITQGELDRTRQDLAASLPPAVRQHLGPDDQPPQPDRTPEARQPTQALPDNMDDLMRRTGLGQPVPAM